MLTIMKEMANMKALVEILIDEMFKMITRIMYTIAKIIEIAQEFSGTSMELFFFPFLISTRSLDLDQIVRPLPFPLICRAVLISVNAAKNKAIMAGNP